ncbi:uncharacterized protein LOC111907768 [Lactuca sativa]|uniref:uncharacterized protein LOC111907768 n=1 Tax=Lactuca sativa TaxID=4236 RepID=UPI0022AFC204|nr:uncharacterized protein LOC111907768 [Lactuca sativa]
MPPHRSARRTERTQTNSPLPPPQFVPVMFQAAVTAAVAAAMSQISTDGARRTGSGINVSTQGDSQGRSKECSYKDFTNGKPASFNGSGCVIDLMQWFEKTKSVFEICACPELHKVKFAACTFSGRALTWWNGHVKSLTLSMANSLSWEDLKTMMMKEYCPTGEVQKLEQELWNLKMTGFDLVAYTTGFNDLALLFPAMVTPENKKVERYLWGLSSQIQDSVLVSKPTTFESAKELEQQLIDHRASHVTVSTTSNQAKGGNNNRKFWSNKKKQPPQDPAKKQQTVAIRAATTATTPTSPKKYVGNLPNCNKCNFHHNGSCREIHCKNCDKMGHTAHFCKAPARPINQVANKGASQTCYRCGEEGHFRRNCPKAQAPNVGGVGRVLVIGHGEEVEEPTVVTDNHSLEIDLMPVTIKCFNIIIGMDWLSSHRPDILCYERAIRLNLPNGKTLLIYGDKPTANLKIISCVKGQKYLRKEYHAFLAHVVDKKQEVKDIKDIPEVCNFPDVFLEDLPGVPLA